MNEEITATTTFDVPSMLVAYRWHNRINWLWRFLRLGLIFLSVAAITAAVDQSQVTTIPPLLIPISAGVGLILGLYLEKRRYVSGLKSSPVLDTKLTFKATEDAVVIISSHSSSTLKWDMFHKTVGTPDGVLLYHQKYLFNWLPKTAFSSESDYQRFLELASSKTKHSKIG